MQHIFGAHLREDLRVEKPPVLEKRIFTDPSYDVFVVLYAAIPGHATFGSMGVSTVSVVYKEEDLKITVKITNFTGDPAKEVHNVVNRMNAEERGPFHVIRDNKKWCNVPFTDQDRARFTKEGVRVSASLGEG